MSSGRRRARVLEVVAERGRAREPRDRVGDQGLQRSSFAEGPGVGVRGEDAVVAIPRLSPVPPLPGATEDGDSDDRVAEPAVGQRSPARDRRHGGS